MDAALILSCVLLGLAGTPHCAAMCGPACAAATCAGQGRDGRVAGLVFQGARALGYALAGALASAGVGAASLAAPAAPALRPFWVLLHCAALALGLWMVATGRQPGWMMRLGASRPGRPSRPSRPSQMALSGAWQSITVTRAGWSAAAAGSLWVAWPCGLLQSALVVAALCHRPASGALAMGGFALASAPGLLVTPWVLGWIRRGGPQRADQGERWVRLAIRVSGAGLAGGALVALNHDAWTRFVAYCTS